MPLTIRKATPDDAPLLVRIVDMASDGVVPMFWAEMAPPGMDGSGVGATMVAAEDGEFSYRNGFIAERDGVELGGLIGYVLPTTPQPIGPEVPEVFVGVEELTQLAPGHWYINFMAAMPDGRRQGVGAALLNEAEALKLSFSLVRPHRGTHIVSFLRQFAQNVLGDETGGSGRKTLVI